MKIQAIENGLRIKLWTHQDRVDSRVNSLNFPNTKGLGIVNVIVPIVYCFTMLELNPFLLI